MTRTLAVLQGLILALSACRSHAAQPPATPATLQRMLDGARAGDVIRLAPGSYDAINLRQQSWDKPVVVEAGDAVLSSLVMRNVAGLTWRGGVFDGQDTQRIGIVVVDSQRLVIEGTRMHNYLRAGIAMTRASDTRMTNNSFDDMGSDGADFAMSRRLVIDGTRCHGFKPTPGAHPDCIQLWSRPTDPPTADITITNTVAEGDMQGISLFNHVRDGVDDGGFDRVTVTNNRVRGTFGNGIAFSDCRACVVRDNVIEAAEQVHNRPRLVIRGTGTVEACNNSAPGTPVSQGQERCRK